MANANIIMHDGNFGADWVNITRGPDIIARVAYQPDGSQRETTNRIVSALSHKPRRADTANNVAYTLAECLCDVRNKLEPNMTPQDVAVMLSNINKALFLVK
jgi:hypothetical protein